MPAKRHMSLHISYENYDYIMAVRHGLGSRGFGTTLNDILDELMPGSRFDEIAEKGKARMEKAK